MIAMIVCIEYCIRIMGDTYDSIVGCYLVITGAWEITTSVYNNLRSVGRYLSDATSYLVSASVDGDVHCLK